MYHAESDSLFEIEESELPALYESYDGGLCVDVTDNPEYQARFEAQKESP